MRAYVYEGGWNENLDYNDDEYSPFNVRLKPINKPWYQNIF